MPNRKIGQMFGVSDVTVGNIIKGKTWKHIIAVACLLILLCVSVAAQIKEPSEQSVLDACNKATTQLIAAREYIRALEAESASAKSALSLEGERAKLQSAVIALREAEATQLRAALDAKTQQADLQSKEIAELKKKNEALERKASKLRKVAGVVGVAAFVAGLVLK